MNFWKRGQETELRAGSQSTLRISNCEVLLLGQVDFLLTSR